MKYATPQLAFWEALNCCFCPGAPRTSVSPLWLSTAYAITWIDRYVYLRLSFQVLANLSMNDTITWIESSFFFALAWSVCSTGTAPVREKLDVLVQELMAGPMSDEMFQLTGMQVDGTIAIIKDINYIAQGPQMRYVGTDGSMVT